MLIGNKAVWSVWTNEDTTGQWRSWSWAQQDGGLPDFSESKLASLTVWHNLTSWHHCHHSLLLGASWQYNNPVDMNKRNLLWLCRWYIKMNNKTKSNIPLTLAWAPLAIKSESKALALRPCTKAPPHGWLCVLHFTLKMLVVIAHLQSRNGPHYWEISLALTPAVEESAFTSNASMWQSIVLTSSCLTPCILYN